jgi:hypothetical protein
MRMRIISSRDSSADDSNSCIQSTSVYIVSIHCHNTDISHVTLNS